MFVQGMWDRKDPLLQLPGFDEEEIKKYRKCIKTHQIRDPLIETFCRLTAEQREKLNLFDGNKAKLNELEKCIKSMPVISVDAKVFTQDEKMITAQDVITFSVTINYDLLDEKTQPGYVCSKKYPYLKKSCWYVIMTDSKTRENVLHFEKVMCKEGDGNKAKFEMKQRFGAPGEFKFYLMILNDSYIGFDVEKELSFTVVTEDKDRVIPEVSKEDLDAIKGPNMVQSMFDSGAQNQESEGESSDDGAESLVQKLEQAGLKKATEDPNKRTTTGDDNQLIR